MVVPGSRRLLARVGPVAWDRFGEDASAVREALDAAERPLARTVVVGRPGVRHLSRLGLPAPLLLSPRGLRRETGPMAADHVHGSPDALPFADDSIDAVVVTAGATTRGTSVDATEAARVLRPGGVLVVAGVDPSTVRGRAVRTASLLRGATPTLLTPVEVTARMEAAGFAPTEQRRGWTFATAGVR